MNPIQCFSMYFCGLVSMNFHPGYHKGQEVATVTYDELEGMADIADRMVAITLKRVRALREVQDGYSS